MFRPKMTNETQVFLNNNAEEKSSLDKESALIDYEIHKKRDVSERVTAFNERATAFNNSLKNAGGQSGFGFRLFLY